MLKLFFILVIIIAGAYIFWLLIIKKGLKFSVLTQQKQGLSQFLKDATSPKKVDQQSEPESIDSVSLEDQQRFDDVAQLFFEKKIIQQNLSYAENIQAEFLNKMPAQTQSQIGEFDFGEWCVFWTYHQQSLEYYVGRYGVFCTHVDQNGVEHKTEVQL